MTDMNTCPADEKWTDLVVGFVEPEERESMLGHACDCMTCAERLEAEQTAWESLDSWQVGDPPEELREKFDLRVVAEDEANDVRRSPDSMWYVRRLPQLWPVGVAALALIVIAVVWFSWPETSLVLRVTSGEVEVLENESWIVSQQVLPGQRLRTTNQSASLISPDGSQITIEPNIQAILNQPASNERFHMTVQRGRAEFEVTSSSDEFVVRVAKTTVRVRGTKFGVDVPQGRADEVSVWVTEGKVEVANDEGMTMLAAGESVVSRPSSSPADNRYKHGNVVLVISRHGWAFPAIVESAKADGIVIRHGHHDELIQYDRVRPFAIKQDAKIEVKGHDNHWRMAHFVSRRNQWVIVRFPHHDDNHEIKLQNIRIPVDH